MVAKTPPGPAREKRMASAAAALNPTLIRETVKKVDRCVARLQELQYTVSGGRKVVGGVSLSPRSTKGYIRTSLRCKQEALRLRNTTSNRSPPGKFPANATGEWRQLSLPAMLLGETVVEILQATQFAKQAVAAATTKSTTATTSAAVDPKTPVSHRSRANPETPELRAKRSREKQRLRGATRSEQLCSSPTLPRARARISFKPTSPPTRRGGESSTIYRHVVAAHRVSPRNRPWAKKTALLFPTPAYNTATTSSPPTNRNQLCKAKLIPKVRQSSPPPHKFIVKSPAAAVSKFQVRIRSPPAMMSPTRLTASRPTKMSTPSKLRRSFSPSRLANRLVSPLKSRISSACRRRSMSAAAGGWLKKLDQ